LKRLKDDIVLYLPDPDMILHLKKYLLSLEYVWGYVKIKSLVTEL
jgi:hypothetical protein